MRLTERATVDRRVAAAIDHHAATKHGLVFAFHTAQYRNGIDDLGGVAGRDHRPFANVGADSEEGGVERSGLHLFEDVVHLAVEPDRDVHVGDALHLGVEHFARQAVLGDAEAHHAAHVGAGVHHRDGVAELAQVVGGRHARGAGTDDQHLLAGFLCRRGELPAALDIASSPRKRSTELMPTASSILPRLQADSQVW
jgi:hypothetical protein